MRGSIKALAHTEQYRRMSVAWVSVSKMLVVKHWSHTRAPLLLLSVLRIYLILFVNFSFFSCSINRYTEFSGLSVNLMAWRSDSLPPCSSASPLIYILIVFRLKALHRFALRSLANLQADFTKSSTCRLLLLLRMQTSYVKILSNQIKSSTEQTTFFIIILCFCMFFFPLALFIRCHSLCSIIQRSKELQGRHGSFIPLCS